MAGIEKEKGVDQTLFTVQETPNSLYTVYSDKLIKKLGKVPWNIFQECDFKFRSSTTRKVKFWYPVLANIISQTFLSVSYKKLKTAQESFNSNLLQAKEDGNLEKYMKENSLQFFPKAGKK